MKKLLTIIQILLLCCAARAGMPWRAKWITKPQSVASTNSWVAFRKDLNLEKVPSSMTARIATDTKYWMWINDSLVVFEGGLKRGPTPGDTYYDEVEIAPYLKEGDNCIAILTWYMGKAGFSHQSSGSVALLFDAYGSDGSVILSDRSWRASEYNAYSIAEGPVPNYRLPESNICFDARKEFTDWNRSCFKARLGSTMVMSYRINEPPFGKLWKRPIPQWKVSGLKGYESVRQSGDTLICRLPYNCQITPWFRIDAPAGKLVRMETDHRIVTGVECIRADYITRSGIQEYESLGWMNGEEMRYVIPEGVKVLDVKYRESGYDTDFTGYFRCDDAFLNEYWQKAARTLYVCMRDTFYDCPDRERAQWWGDEVNELGMAFFALSRSADRLARKGMLELCNWSFDDGAMHAPVPASNYSSELPMQILASVGWYGFHNYWFYSGDDSVISEVYPAVHKYLHETWKTDTDGLPIYRYGGWDWPDAGENRDRFALLAPWYYLALKGERAFAEQLGLSKDVEEDSRMMDTIYDSYNRLFWNGKEYRTPGFEEHPDDRVQAMAVVSGLASPDKYPQIADILSKEYHATTYMQRYVLEALFIMGKPKEAIERMHKLYPTVMKDGCSTLWEHWNYDGSCNHAWTGGAIIEMERKLAGIEPLEPGFRRFRVAPQIGPLKHIETGFDTNFGRIEVIVDSKGKNVSLTLTVPEGTTAEVPLGQGNEVKTFGPGTHTVRIGCNLIKKGR